MRNFPKSPRRIARRADLPKSKTPASYCVETPSGQTVLHANKRKRQVLEALIEGPIFCASAVRIGPRVQELREELGKEFITTNWHRGYEDGEPIRFGSYELAWNVKEAQQ